MRLAGFLVSAGLILGRSVAGDFHSWNATWHDFVLLGFPVLPLLAAAIILQLWLRPTRKRPRGRVLLGGLLALLAMVLFALVDLWISGMPAHGLKGS